MTYINNVEVEIKNGAMDEREIEQYVHYLNKKFPSEMLKTLTLTLDGEEVDMSYTFQPLGFERIRRITGYLVGTMDRFNDAKAAEEHDRVKHGV